MAPSEYMIYQPQKLRLSHLCRLLLFRKKHKGSELVESSSHQIEHKHLRPNSITIFTLILQRVLIWLRVPVALYGYFLEFILNLVSVNGGVLRLINQTIKGSVVIPNRKSADFRSILAHVDGRFELYDRSSTVKETTYLELSMMASKIAYENEAYILNVVNNHWKMHLVGFYDFWNEFLGKDETQAFILCDREEDAQLIVVAFRGTEVYNTIDWCTDVDLSWFSMGNMGKVHLGFMKALGLQDDKDYKNGWPKDYKGSHDLAYYSIRDKLKALIQDNKDAQIVITGHSLGGALAILFPSVLILHQEEMLMSHLLGIYTFGQPRVGDEEFGNFMKEKLDGIAFQKKKELDGIYYRMVYRYDIIPRVPFHDAVFQFSHFGLCIYYKSWYKGMVLLEEPDPNFFSLRHTISIYLNAWLDLFRALLITITQGGDYKESFASIVLRIIGLVNPGFANHSPRDYLNSVRLAKISIDEEEECCDSYG